MEHRRSPMILDLLLAPADEAGGEPHAGLRLDSLQHAPQPEALDEPDALWDATGDPNDLCRQRWGLVAPSGARGEQLLGLVEPLRRWRQEQQGADVRVYRVKPVMDAAYARRWKREVYRDERTSELNRPRYLLLLGD